MVSCFNEMPIDQYQNKPLASLYSFIHPSNAAESLVFCASLVQLGFDFLVDEGFVVFEVLLDVDFELDDVVEDLLDLGVQFFAQGVGAEGQLFESRRGQSAYRNRPRKSPIEVAHRSRPQIAHRNRS